VLTSIASRLLLPLLLLPMPAAGADKITFDDHVFPVFEQACLNCHNPDKAKGGLDLSTFGATLKGGSGGKIVDAGDTGAKLIAVMTHSAEPKMPPEGDKVAADKIALLKQWIEGGLLENKSSSARKPTKPKFDVAMGGNPTAKPEGPPPMPEHLLLEPVVAASRGTAVRSLAASPWAPLLATTSQQQVLLYNTDNLRLAAILPFPAGDPVSLAFTPDGRYLIAGGGIAGKSGTTVTWDVKTGEIMLQAGKEFDSVLAADLRPDFGAVATGSPSRLLKLWNSADGEMAASIKKHTDWITALDYTPDGVLLASGDRNGGVWAWEAQAGAEFHTLRAHQARITGLVFRADSNVLASASEDGTVRFWEMNGGNEIKKVDAHGNGVLGFSWARDGSFATIGRDRKIKTWKPDFNLRKEMTLESALPTCVALAADGSKVFVGDYDGEISVWHAAEGKRLGSMPSNPPTISSRLATLRERIRTHPQAIAGAEAGLAEARKKLEAARKQLADAEAIAKQKQEAHQQARREETQWKKRIETLDAKIAQLDRKSKSLTTGRDQAKAERPPQGRISKRRSNKLPNSRNNSPPPTMNSPRHVPSASRSRPSSPPPPRPPRPPRPPSTRPARRSIRSARPPPRPSRRSPPPPRLSRRQKTASPRYSRRNGSGLPPKSTQTRSGNAPRPANSPPNSTSSPPTTQPPPKKSNSAAPPSTRSPHAACPSPAPSPMIPLIQLSPSNSPRCSTPSTSDSPNAAPISPNPPAN
jgi:WD40 repeat protein